MARSTGGLVVMGFELILAHVAGWW